MAESLRFDLLANDKASAVFNKVGDSAAATESRFSKVGASLAAVGKVAAVGLAAGVGAGAVALGRFVTEARESEKVTKLTESIIKSTGGAAKVTAAQVAALSTSISNKTGVDDEAIQTGSNLLLTFKNVRNELGDGNKVFDEATAAAVDLSAAGFGSIDSSAKMLGKALNDPIAGISALGRAGVTFTAQQKEQIAAMVETGDVLGAQKVILGEVQSQVGGAAAATGTAMDKAKVAVGNLGESIGTALLPTIDSLAATFTSRVVPAVAGFVTGFQTGTGAGGTFATVLRTIGSNLGTIAPVLGIVVTGLAAYKIASLGAAAAAAVQTAGTVGATGATWSLNAALRANPIGMVITGLTLLGAGLVVAYKRSETFRNVVDGAFSAVRNVVSNVMPAIIGAVQAGMNNVQNVIKVVTAVFRGDWQGAWASLRDIAASALSAMRGVVSAGFSAIRGIFNSAGNALRASMADAWGGIMSAVGNGISAVVGAVKTLPGKVLAGLGGLSTLLYSAGVDLVRGMINGIQAMAGQVMAAARNLASQALSTIKSALKISSPSKETYKLGQFFSEGFGGGIKARTKLAVQATSELAKKSLEKLQGLRDQAAGITGGIADSMRGSLDLSSLGGKREDGSQMNVTDQLGDFAARAGSFANSLAAAAAKGLNSKLIARIADLGPGQGLTAAQALAAMDQAQVASANASLSAVDAYAAKLGQTVLTTTSLPGDIAREQGILNALQAIQADLRAGGNIQITVNDATDPDKVVAAIRRYIKRNGKLRDVAEK